MPVPIMLEDTSDLRRQLRRRHAALKTERQPWLEFCRQVAEELMPSRLPYLADPFAMQQGGQQNRHICDGAGHLALDTAAAGITHGTMPEASKWFDLVIRGLFGDDDDLKLFLEEGGTRLLAMHNQSNASLTFPDLTKEWLGFGVAAGLLVEDDEDGFRVDAMTVGQYCIAEDSRGRVDTCYREYTQTVGQLAEEFGKDRLCPSSLAAYDRGDYDQVVRCVHAIEPDREEWNSDDLPWRSVYWEESSDATQVLDVRGFRRFPVLVWRFSRLPGQAYGHGRGMDALPHLVRLRKMIYRYGQAMAKQADPPTQGPPGLQAHEVKALPGGHTSVFGGQEIKPLYPVPLRLQELAEEIRNTKQDIRDTLGATLVASLRSLRHQMTAREADLRTTQDLQEFLPGLARQREELLNPYIEWLWDRAMDMGMLPEPPSSLAGQTIDIEYSSPLARKQRSEEVDAIVRTYAIAAEIFKVRPDVVDNLDPDTAIRIVQKIEGAPMGVIAPIEEVRKLRASRAQTQLAQQQAAAAQQGVDIARGAAEATQRLQAVG